jgi:sulfate adenylyltransferase subunit 1
MDIFRFITAGSVDDGKSTLIGRLLFDSKNIKDDILQSVERRSDIGPIINLAHITDGLRSERDLGITIDVAYKYFTTPNRKYIITDAPGHFQYTKNLVTGASGVDAIIILIDAQNSITEQTRRHSLVASFLKIPNVVVAINKIDLFHYSEQVYLSIKNEYQSISEALQLPEVTFIPISALYGDNIFSCSTNMDWYLGNTLMDCLEKCNKSIVKSDPARFTIQYQNEREEYYLYAGKVLSGKFQTGQILSASDTNKQIILERITNGYNEIKTVHSGENVYFYTDKTVKLKRGDILFEQQSKPLTANTVDIDICWLSESQTLCNQQEIILSLNNAETHCVVEKILYKTDINTFEKRRTNSLLVNELGRVKIKTENVITLDNAIISPESGRGILICPLSNQTLAAFTIT